MIYIITGPIDSGKTTRLYDAFRALGTGGGFLLKKQMGNGIFVGQSIVRMTDLRAMPFSYKLPYVPAGWDEAYRYADFSFSRAGLWYASEIVDEAIHNGYDPIFIDEIGPLELNRSGFYPLLCQLLCTNRNLYLAVRKSCIHDVLNLFNIKESKIL